MRLRNVVFTGIFLFVAMILFLYDSAAERSPSEGHAGFAVVELFTSEGCSSCPPADRLLGEIVSQARAKEQPIYGLAFHVDYWDYIGWKDPYASSEFSERQRRYAQAFGSSRIYTPQMVVNGRKEFVGSNEGQASSTIESALDQPPAVKVNIALSDVRASAGSVKFSYEVPPAPEDAVIHFAVVERHLEQNIGRGENRGRTLQHENVVRAFKTISAHKSSDALSLTIPEDVQLQNSSLIAYVQHDRTMEVLGATGVDIVGSGSRQ